MQKFRLAFGFIVMLCAGLVLSVVSCDREPPPFKCTDTLGCVNLEPHEAIKIGVVQALSGQVAPLGTEQVRGTELAIDKHQGMLLGHPISLQIEDTGCTAEGGANSALKLIADPQTVAILGTTCSGAAVTASQAMSNAGLTMISGNNSAPFLTAIDGHRAPNWQAGYFRTAPNEENSGKTAAMFAFEKLGVRKVATINDGDIYTKGLTDGFKQKFQSLGGEIVLAAAVTKGEKEMEPVLTAVLNSGAQLLFFPLFQPDGNNLVLQARKMAGFERITLMSDGALIESSFIDAVGDSGKGMYFVGPFHPTGTAVDDLTRDYRLKYNASPSADYFLNAYDAACLLMNAIEKVAVQSPDGSLHIGHQALRNALYAVRNFKGVTGSLTCNEFGDCAVPAFNILRLDHPRQGLKGLLSNIQFTYRLDNRLSQR